jgi:hypothetical protein
VRRDVVTTIEVTRPGFGRFDDQVDCLSAGRAGRGRLDLPAHRVADKHVADDLATLQFDVADLKRRADDRRLGFAEEEDDLAVRSLVTSPGCRAICPRWWFP